MQINYEITKREKDILKLLWKSEKALTASELAANSDNISISTIQTALKNLMKKGLVKVDEIVYSGTVLSRSFKPVLTSTQYELQKLVHSLKHTVDKDISASSFVATLLEQEKNNEKALQEIAELEEILAKRKAYLEHETN